VFWVFHDVGTSGGTLWAGEDGVSPTTQYGTFMIIGAFQVSGVDAAHTDAILRVAVEGGGDSYDNLQVLGGDATIAANSTLHIDTIGSKGGHHTYDILRCLSDGKRVTNGFAWLSDYSYTQNIVNNQQTLELSI
jgi:hypothetical protein